VKKTNEQMAMRAGAVTIIGDIALSSFKLFAGIVGNSTAMIADAMHSLSDMYSTIIVMIGIKLANRRADKDHPYGHERFECVAAILLSAVLVVTGVGIGWVGIERIIESTYQEPIIPGVIALVAALATIVLKGVMYLYKRRIAKKINSTALLADAWHHLSDSLSSIGSFLGILGARMGFPILDPIAAVIICLFILKVAVDVFRDAVSKMTDRAADDETENEIKNVILSNPDVMSIDVLKTRVFGERLYVEVEIGADGTKTLNETHEIAENVHDMIEAKFPNVKHCTVHVNPADSESSEKGSS